MFHCMNVKDLSVDILLAFLLQCHVQFLALTVALGIMTFHGFYCIDSGRLVNAGFCRPDYSSILCAVKKLYVYLI